MYGIRSNIDGSLLMESFIAIFQMQISIFEKEFIIRNPAIFHLKKKTNANSKDCTKITRILHGRDLSI